MNSGKIAVTCGDPAGVGPEVIQKWLREHPPGRDELILIGPENWLAEVRAEGDVETRAAGKKDFRMTPGAPSAEGAKAAWDALEEAARGCREGRYRAVVTAPVSKIWMRRAGFGYPGHTEFFADRWGGEPVMGFIGERMKVVLATWHIPLAEVSKRLTEPVVTRAAERAAWLAAAYGAREPRIGFCGLNPHAGEEGMMGTEERDRLDPLLARLRGRFPGLSRCQPADTVFHRQIQGEFDVVVALYHDQGLGPLKTLEFDSAVNVTLGLAHVRASPDHGTAFDIAGRGKASARSFHNAVAAVRRLAGRDPRRGVFE